MVRHEPMEKQYDPSSVEGAVYEKWLAAKAFAAKPDERPHEQTFTMVIPPPNVTGALHLGHALNNTLQDILVRYHRMRGFNTLWQPGTDHAGIATQAVVEKRIREKEGMSRHDIGREELVRRIWAWKDEYEKRIIGQLQLMGCSCDWDRTRFTLDDGLAAAVRTQFFDMFKAGLIFRGKRLVNWDTELQTAVANDEVYYETVKGKFWHFKYPVIDPKPGEPEYVVIATTRPETMLGDTAVAVCADPAAAFDKQEAKLRDDLENATDKDKPAIEKKLEALAERRGTHMDLLTRLAAMARDDRKLRLPLVGRVIPLIADPWANPLLGTGCVKITPAHDPNDYEVGLRHDLPMINVMTPDGKIAEIVEPDKIAEIVEPSGSRNEDATKRYDGLVFAAEGRERVVEDMDARGLLADVIDHEHEQGHSDRSKAPIEPYLSDQWFVQTEDVNEETAQRRGEPPCDSSPALPDTSSGADAHPSPEPQASACAVPRARDLAGGATLLTWTTYGTWLPGDKRGFVSRVPDDDKHILHNAPGEPYDSNETGVECEAARKLKGKPTRLTREQSHLVLRTIAGTCERHGIELLAVAIMPNHVHVLCQGEQHGAELLQLVKGSASRALGKAFDLPEGSRWWTKSGSRRRIRASVDLTAAIEYVKDQHRPLALWSLDQEDGETHEIVSAAQAEACGSGGIELPTGATIPGLAQGAMDAVTEGRVQVFPSRYGKSYLDWLGEKRDWCISRQLWWGHRIGVWTISLTGARNTGPGENPSHEQDQSVKEQALFDLFGAAGLSDDLCVRSDTWMERHSDARYVCSRTPEAHAFLDNLAGLYAARKPGAGTASDAVVHADAFKSKYGEAAFGIAVKLEGTLRFFGQEEDVLDTWFSSALWPFSTLGWPGTSPENLADVAQYYPGSVLCTSRDIITNWVARMVMFGLFSTGKVPFDHVYIHPKILDGRGETMSKSKGNGVDPVDVIHTHGADALRYTMADLCTETQDIRMPVEYVCPHCRGLTDQTLAIKTETQLRKSRGEKLKRKLQPADCHRVTCANKACGKEFATRWSESELQEELGIARETSDKFDIGRNFCTKLWNAARFAMMNLEGIACRELDIAALPPEDRWILARLSQTIARYHDYLKHYQFAASVRELREFFWDSLCDWYIELTKPRLTAAADAASSTDPARQVLAFCLDQVLRLWHPTMPFITERIWAELNDIAPMRGLLPAIKLKTEGLLVSAEFPPVGGHEALSDDAIIETFASLQTVTRGVRDLRLSCDVPPKQRVNVTVVAPAAELDAFTVQSHIVRHMAGIAELMVVSDAKRPQNAASLNVGGLKIYVHDISDDEAERTRTVKTLAELEKKIEGTKRKLGNEKFVANAKPEVVAVERTRLAEFETQHASLTAHLAELNA